MFRFVVVLVATTVGSAAYAQSAPEPHAKHQKAAPAVQASESPADIVAVPSNVQKWFSGAVDGILSGADPENRKR